VLHLSEPVYGESSIAAAGVAAHEVGHAIQDAQGYVWGKVRSALVPVAQFGSGAAIWLIIIGVAIRVAGLAWVGIAFYAAAVLFQIVTLPVEFDASRRALASLQVSGTMSEGELSGARQVLNAAALTYVAGALVAVLQLLYWIGFARRD
jgi:Zn-dependent membrane protease YugP